jgi:outer membrane protein OmpA-like peptidoglycan-associated protein
MMKKLVLVVPVLALALSGTTACATKKFVRTNVAEVNNKVDTLSKSVEENQERTKANEARIGEVDQRVSQADQKAVQAGSRADQAYSAAEAVNGRADAIEKASRRLVYEVVLSEDKGNFKFGKATMPDEAKAELDTLVQQLKAEPKGAYIEIEGHTDNVGDAAYMIVVAPKAVRPDMDRVHDISTSIETDVPETSTRVVLLYRVSNAFGYRPVDDAAGLDSRFGVQVHQSLPFMDFSTAKWEMLLGVRNFFREASADQSVYDELLVIRPPKRLVGGLTMRF